MEKELHNLEDFLNDDHFRSWVLEQGADPLNIYWRKWLEDHPDKAVSFHQAVKILETLRDQSVPWATEHKEQTLRHIQSAIREDRSEESKTIPLYPARQKRSYGWYKIAVSAAIVFLLTAAIWQLVVFRSSPAENGIVHEWIIQSSKDQRAEVQLPDGSIVVLNAGSELKYDRSGFGKGSREVFLTGEAFFDVYKDPANPFRVHSNELITTALGTSFNVRAYPGLLQKIQLATGRVKVDKTGDDHTVTAAVILDPGQEAILESDGGLHIQQVPISHIDAWRKGSILFDRTPFDEAVKILEIWYGAEIVVKGIKDAQPLINGRFDNEQLDKILESMQFSLGFHYTIDGKQVTIEFY